MHRVSFALIATVALTTLAGCGGSSSGSSSASSSGKPVSHAQFVSTVDGVCAQRNAKIEALPRALARPTTAQAAATYLENLLGITRPLLAQLHQVNAPAADQGAWSKALGLNDHLTQVTQQALDAAKRSDLPAFRRATSGIPPLGAQLDTYARQLGLTQCLKKPTPAG